MKPQKNRARDIGFYVLILLILLATVYTMTRNTQAKTYKYSEIYDLFKKEQVDSFYVDGTNLVLTLKADKAAAASATDTAPTTVTYQLSSFTVFYNDFNDMMIGEIPFVLRKRVYAVASLAGGCVYYGMYLAKIGSVVSAVTGIAVVFTIRMLATAFRWSLPKIH